MIEKPTKTTSNHSRTATTVAAATVPALLAAMIAATLPPAAYAQEASCSQSAQLLRFACAADARDDFFTATARCIDAAVPEDACLAAADEAFDESRDECGEVFAARLELCEALDDATHEPPFGLDFAASFIDPRAIGFGVAPNPYFPLVAGNRWVYADESETITVEVTGDTKLIDGMTCVTVNDVVMEDEAVIEDTDDWYAQDVDGNVWYCGEVAQNFELFDGDVPASAELVDLDGSWKHGRDAAKGGLLLPFAPNVGDVIRQELKFTDAEDAIEILSTTATESAPAGSCSDNCLQTRDFTPLEPDAEEHKFYAPGIGLIVEVDPATGDRLELIEFVGVGQ